MKIYTKTGDEGHTGLFGGKRVSKADPRVEAYGAVDELNSAIGVARAAGLPDACEQLFDAIQSELFDIGAELAAVPSKSDKLFVPLVTEPQIAKLEQAIDASEERLEPLQTFVLPGGTPGAAQLHVARTTCRRAERRVVRLAGDEEVRPEVIRYLNRLSDLLFSWARLANREGDVPDRPWSGRDRA